jgi:putative PEP-CTERM system TPR-repeat lipoprotein
MTRFVAAIVIPAVVSIATTGCGRSVEARKQAFLESGNRYFDKAMYKEAAVEYRNAVQLDDRFGEARARLAATYERLNDPAHALSEYVRAADLRPDDNLLQLAAGEYLLVARRFEEAQRRAESVLKQDGSNVRAQVLLGNSLGGLRQFDDAVTEMERAIRLDPERAGTYAQLGLLESGRGQPTAAEAAFRKAVTVDPKWIPGYLALANHYWSTRQLPAAENTLRQALAIEPANPMTNRGLTLFLIATGRAAEAEPYVKVLSSTRGGTFALADYYIANGRPDEAMSELLRLRANAEMYDAASRRLARAYGMRQDWANVNKVADELLARNPSDAEMLLVKGRVLLQQGRRADALEHLKQAAKSNVGSPTIQFALGQAFAGIGDTDEARRAFAEALRLEPGMTSAQVELARLDLSAGQSDDAVRRSREAVRTAPANVQAQLTLARALLARGDLTAADDVLHNLLQSRPDDPRVQVQRGITFGYKKDYPAARAAFQRALELAPGMPEAIGALVALDLTVKDFHGATSRIDAALTARPDQPQLLLIAARTYAATRDLEGAARLLKRAIELDSSLLGAYTLLGQVYVTQGKLDDAKREFQVVAGRQSKPVGALTVLGMIAEIQKDSAKAKEAYEQVLLMDPRAPIAANNLAWMYAEQGENLDTALQYAKNAAQQLPQVGAIQDTLGWVYYKKQMPEQAIAALTASVVREPQNPMFHFHLGLALRQGGDAVRAQQSLERALGLSSTFEGASTARQVLSELGGERKQPG